MKTVSEIRRNLHLHMKELHAIAKRRGFSLDDVIQIRGRGTATLSMRARSNALAEMLFYLRFRFRYSWLHLAELFGRDHATLLRMMRRWERERPEEVRELQLRLQGGDEPTITSASPEMVGGGGKAEVPSRPAE